jgi:hypothetical protein
MPNFMNNFAACCDPPEAVFGWRLSKQSGRSFEPGSCWAARQVVATKDLKQSCYSKPYMKGEVEQGMNHEAHHLVELISGRIWQSKLEKYLSQ